MKPRPYSKTSQRFVMYIPNALREEIETWVNKRGITFAEFGREAFKSYLQNQRREERRAQLVETCLIFENNNSKFLNDWSVTDNENWPV
ncbi:MAG: hypothetical protein ACE5IW_01555 [bacterium]